MTSLAGHTNEATAYVVADYPYGYTTRTSIRYWVESDAKKGSRFVSQTMNPKTGRWNAPKKGTYERIALALFLDSDGHVKPHGVNEYTSALGVDRFVESSLASLSLADSTRLYMWVKMKANYTAKHASGEAFWTVNGVRQSVNDEEKSKLEAEAAVWSGIVAKMEANAGFSSARRTA